MSARFFILLALSVASALSQSRPRDIAPIMERRLETVGLVNSGWVKMATQVRSTLEFDYESGAPSRAVAPRTWIDS
jgi:hypothetical protein